MRIQQLKSSAITGLIAAFCVVICLPTLQASTQLDERDLTLGASSSTSVSAGNTRVTASTSVSASASDSSTHNISSVFGLRFQANVASNVRVREANQPNGTSYTATGSIGTYWALDQTVANSFSADLIYSVNQTVLDALGYSISNLRWAFYNTTANAWQAQTDTKIDVSAKTVTYTTTHFSDWTVTSSSSAAGLVSPSFVIISLFSFLAVLNSL